MRRKPLRKTKRRKVERFVKRNVKSKIFRFLLLGMIIGGFYYYNEIYIHTLETSVLYDKEASDFTCDLLETTQEITLKQDKGNEKDKYGRTLAWVYLDDIFLQEALIEKGYAKTEYIQYSTVDRKLLSLLETKEKKAIEKELGIWK